MIATTESLTVEGIARNAEGRSKVLVEWKDNQGGRFQRLCEISVPAFNPPQVTWGLSCAERVPSASHYEFRVTADYLNWIDESNEGNNTLIRIKRPRNVEISRMQTDTDRPGMDYRNFTPRYNNPYECSEQCDNESRCKAWTYVHSKAGCPGSRCWLKSGIPEPVNNSCTTSGIK
jgi:hypothetical protein